VTYSREYKNYEGWSAVAKAETEKWELTEEFQERLKKTKIGEIVSDIRKKTTGSHPNSEVKRLQARLVLRWGTAWEVRVTTALFISKQRTPLK
jgi:hypothetical protein